MQSGISSNDLKQDPSRITRWSKNRWITWSSHIQAKGVLHHRNETLFVFRFHETILRFGEPGSLRPRYVSKLKIEWRKLSLNIFAFFSVPETKRSFFSQKKHLKCVSFSAWFLLALLEAFKNPWPDTNGGNCTYFGILSHHNSGRSSRCASWRFWPSGGGAQLGCWIMASQPPDPFETSAPWGNLGM